MRVGDDDQMGSGGSGSEELEVVSSPEMVETTPPPLPPKTKVPRRPHKVPRKLLSDEEDEDPKPISPTPSPVKEKKTKGGKRSRGEGNQDDSAQKSDVSSAQASTSRAKEPDEPRPKRPTVLNLKNPHNAMMAKELEFQKAMDIAVGLLVPLKVDTKALTMCPDAGTLECFVKGVTAWLSEHRMVVPLIYTTQKTFRTLTAKILMEFVIKSAGLNTGSWNPSGCYVWRHRSDEERGLHCFHGTPMVAKDQMVEMDITSEAGQRALRENAKAKVVPNKWGKQVVQIINSDAACCASDAACSGGNMSSRSCGMFFTEATKALMALRQISAYQLASYPAMGATASEMILAPLKCECNWNTLDGSPQHGRQLSKITPFAITGISNIDRTQVEDPKVHASLDNPAVLVFQCCNPVQRGARTSATSGAKNCDWKISAPDVITAVQVAKKIWASSTGQAATPRFPEFKWGPQYNVQNVILPTGIDDDAETLF